MKAACTLLRLPYHTGQGYHHDDVSKNETSVHRNEIVRKTADLKSVKETVKAFEIAKEGSQSNDEKG